MRVATFYDLPGIPILGVMIVRFSVNAFCQETLPSVVEPKKLRRCCLVRLFISLLLGTIVSWGAEEPPDLRLYVAALKKIAVRESAALAISKKEGDGASAAPYLAEATADPDPNVRLAAIQALGAVKSESALAVGALIKCLDGGEGSIPRAAAKALGSIGKAAAAAQTALLKKLSNTDVDMENAAVSALGKIRGIPK